MSGDGCGGWGSQGSLIASFGPSLLSVTSLPPHLTQGTHAAASFPTPRAIHYHRRRGRERWAAHLRLMTKAVTRMRRRTTLPTTDTISTVELAPSPMMGAGTVWGRRKES